MVIQVLAPDAQCRDDTEVERRTAGDWCRFKVHRRRDFAAIAAE